MQAIILLLPVRRSTRAVLYGSLATDAAALSFPPRSVRLSKNNDPNCRRTGFPLLALPIKHRNFNYTELKNACLSQPVVETQTCLDYVLLFSCFAHVRVRGKKSSAPKTSRFHEYKTCSASNFALLDMNPSPPFNSCYRFDSPDLSQILQLVAFCRGRHATFGASCPVGGRGGQENTREAGVGRFPTCSTRLGKPSKGTIQPLRHGHGTPSGRAPPFISDTMRILAS